EAEALNLAATLPAARDSYLTVTRHLAPDRAHYHSVWLSRSSVTRILERRHLDLLASQDPQTRQLGLQLQDVRQRLARLLFASTDSSTTHAEQLRQLTDEKEKLEQQLARRLQLERRAVDVPAATPDQLAERLPEGTAFVDLIRYVDFEQDPEVKGA